MTGQDVIQRVTDARFRAADTGATVYEHVQLPAGEIVFDAPIEHVAAEWSDVRLAITGAGVGITRMIFDCVGPAAITTTRGVPDGPTFSLRDVSVEMLSPDMDAVLVQGVMRQPQLISGFEFVGGRRGLVLARGTNQCGIHHGLIRNTREEAVYADITETGACMLIDVTVQREFLPCSWCGQPLAPRTAVCPNPKCVDANGNRRTSAIPAAFRFVSHRTAQTGGEGNVDVIGCRAFGFGATIEIESDEQRDTFAVFTHCHSDSYQNSGPGWLIKNGGNNHFSNCWGVTHGEGASAWSFDGAELSKMTGCTGWAYNGPNICLRNSKGIVITGGVYNGPVQFINADDASTYLEANNLRNK